MKHQLLIAALGVAACSAMASTAFAKDISFEQLPPAVQATVTRETQGGTITDIELEDGQGVVTYEVEYTSGGTKYELEVAASGRLLRRTLD
jgi:uncharacterized membrane protein YkoI